LPVKKTVCLPNQHRLLKESAVYLVPLKQLQKTTELNFIVRGATRSGKGKKFAAGR
jgi:hypothetical protein